MSLTGQSVTQKPAKVKPDRLYMHMVKQLPCVICSAPPPSDAHHCTHRPDHGEKHSYDRIPSAGLRSGDRDTIPLCKKHHQDGPEAIHNDKAGWRDKHGPDYGFIPAVRAAVAGMMNKWF